MVIIGCSASGKIRGHHYKDSVYSFEVSFPYEYGLTAFGQRDVKRVRAMKWQGDVTLRMKPTFVVSVVDSNIHLANVVAQERTIHFEPKYYMNCEVDNEELKSIDAHDVYFIYYEGLGVKAVTAFVLVNNYAMKIEYVIDADFYDEQELITVLESITVIQDED
jgi:hypothetical protein